MIGENIDEVIYNFNLLIWSKDIRRAIVVADKIKQSATSQ